MAVHVKTAEQRKACGKRVPYAHRLAIKAQAQANPQMTETEIARENGISRQSVDAIIRDQQLAILSANEITQLKNGIIGRSLLVSNAHIVAASKQEKIDKLNGFQNAIVGKMMFENARLGLNESTSNVSHHTVIEHLDADRAKLMEQMQALDGEAA